MKCLCDTEMVDTTDFGSGDMRSFICPTCLSSMQLHKDMLAEYHQRYESEQYISSALRSLVTDIVRSEMKRQSDAGS